MTRVGVVGAGPMGCLHARNVARVAERRGGFSLSSVFDRHEGRAEALAREYAASVSGDLEALCEQCDVAIVCVPTAAHFEIARQLLEAGLDLLIEKPFTARVSEGETLVALSEEAGRVLQVGHVEWYNPAWREVVESVGAVRRIEVDRFQPASDRGRDIDVIQDLMLHDLDWTTRFLGRPVIEIVATGRRGPHGLLDAVEAQLEFEGGCVVALRSNRVHQERRREVRIMGEGGEARADLDVATDAAVPLGEDGTRRSDPLEAQWLDFIEATERRIEPVNSGRVGVDALRLVERLRDAIVADSGRSRFDDDSRLCR